MRKTWRDEDFILYEFCGQNMECQNCKEENLSRECEEYIIFGFPFMFCGTIKEAQEMLNGNRNNEYWNKNKSIDIII